MKIILVGNQNCGKTTLFNKLTGAHAKIANYPGVTVSSRIGEYKYSDGLKAEIVDLPGLYSLSAYTSEEIVSRDVILNEKPDVIINVVDSTNLVRSLYLTTQLMELDIPVVVALNVIDEVEKKGEWIKKEELEDNFKVPFVPVSALKDKKDSISTLMYVAREQSGKKRKGFSVLRETQMNEILIKAEEFIVDKGIDNPVFHAVKLIEGDRLECAMHEDETQIIEDMKNALPADIFEGDFEAKVADARYKYLSKYFSNTVVKKEKAVKSESKTDKIDKVLTHKIWGIPLLIAIMFAIFHVTFSEDLLFLNALFGFEINNEVLVNILTGMAYEGEAIAIPSLGVFLQSWFGFITGGIIEIVASIMPEGTWYTGLLVDGILTGIDAVCSFIPQVLLLFLFLSILEQCGYVNRAIFLFDNLFRRLGLSGKSFIPMIMGFGCLVPAIMGTKIIDDDKERQRTIRVITGFSCAAKAPIYGMLVTVAVMAGSVFGDIFIFSIYLGGILFSLVAAYFMKLFSGKGAEGALVMELPEYRAPQAINILALLWEKFEHYIYKAATIITASIIVIWFTQNFSWAFWEGFVDIEDSILASIGRVLAVIFAPLGWAMGDEGWKYAVASITGLIAKENVVATMVALGLDGGNIALSIPAIYAFAAFNLVTVPCFAAIGVAGGESASKRGFAVTVIWWLLSSYVVSLVIYWVGTLFEASVLWGIVSALGVIALMALLAVVLKKVRK